MRNTDAPLLVFDNLSVQFDSPDRTVHAVNGIDLEVAQNETIGIVGESGSGKSVSARAALGLLGDTATVGGSVRFDGRELFDQSDSERRDLRGDRISMIFQDPGSSLNPVLTTGDQVSETIRTHNPPAGEEITRRERTILGNLARRKDGASRFAESWEHTVDLFDRVGIPLPEERALDYPHEFSGGMKQRALIAIAIACQPDLLIADEPTTALDVTIEAQILDLLDALQDEFGTSILFITHDMGVVHEVCDRVAVMYAGNIVETAPTDDLFDTPKHPYTEALLRSVPRLDGDASLNPLPGRVPDASRSISGCPFAERCAHANDACRNEFPPAYPVMPEDDPLPVIERAVDTVTEPPTLRTHPNASGEPTHHTHCVLYGDRGPLTREGGDDGQ